MKLLPVVAGVVVLGGLMLSGGSASAMPDVSPQDRPRGWDQRESEQDQLWNLSKQVEAMGVLPGFAEFTQPSAWIESRFNPAAENNPSANAARGFLGMRPNSSFNWRNDLTHLQSRSELLFDPRWNVAMAADYARRLIQFNTEPGQKVTMADLRRGWKQPHLTRSQYRASEIPNLNQFTQAVNNVGADPALPNKQITLGNWPGVQAVLDRLGAPSP